MRRFKFRDTAALVGVTLLVISIIALARLHISARRWLRRPAARDATEVAKYLHDHAVGRDGLWDWYAFISISIVDENLDEIRKRAETIDINTATGRATLKQLTTEAEALAQADATSVQAQPFL